MNTFRFIMVAGIRTLKLFPRVDASKLSEALEEYKVNQIAYIRDQMLRVLKSEDANAQIGMLCSFLEESRKEGRIEESVRHMIELYSIDHEEFHPEVFWRDPVAERRLLGLLDRWALYLDMQFTFDNRISIARIGDREVPAFVVDSLELHHFAEIYGKLKDKASCMLGLRRKQEPTCSVISDWYSGKNQMNDNEMLQETLRFILRYYYLHQFRIHDELSETTASISGGLEA